MDLVNKNSFLHYLKDWRDDCIREDSIREYNLLSMIISGLENEPVVCRIDNFTGGLNFSVITVEDIIQTIKEEIENSPSEITYLCEDGTEISTDVGYVKEWFDEYQDVLLRKYSE
jgi:hypothetical protein